MTTVTETLDLPSGATPTGATVTIELVGTKGHPVRGFVTGTATVVGPFSPTLTAGAWSADLVPNGSITPSGTVYKRSVNGRGYSAVDFFSVPASGTHTLFSLLTDPPGALTPSGLAAHQADTEGAHAASAISFTPTGTIAATNVQAAIVEAAAEAGGVTSVDGATGAVDLTGTYLQLPTGTKAAGKLPLASGAGATDHAWTALAKGDVGLGNVDNTSDANKPVSTATQTALDAKAPAANPVFTGTVTIPDGALAIADTNGLQAALDAKAPAANPVFTGTVTIPDGALAIADTNGLQAALDAKAVASDLLLDSHVWWAPKQWVDSQVGTWAQGLGGGNTALLNAVYGIEYYNSSLAQNDGITWKLPRALQAGTYSLTMQINKASNCAIHTIETSVNGSAWTSQTTVDGYAASPSYPFVTTTGLTIPTGTQYIRTRGATRNGSSSGWVLVLYFLELYRTA